MPRLTKAGKIDGRSKSSATNAVAARDKLIEYIKKGQEICDEDFESDEEVDDNDDKLEEVQEEDQYVEEEKETEELPVVEGDGNDEESEEEESEEEESEEEPEPEPEPEPVPVPKKKKKTKMREELNQMKQLLYQQQQRHEQMYTKKPAPVSEFQRRKTQNELLQDRMRDAFANSFG